MDKNSWQYRFVISSMDTGKTIKELLTEWMVPKHLRGSLRQHKRIFVGKHQVPVSHVLENKQELTFELWPEDFEEIQNYKSNQDVKLVPDFIEEDFVVVNKPSGMKMHPHSPTEDDTLLNYLEHYLIENKIQTRGRQARAMMVHRLDRDTSGLVLVALNPLAVAVINRMIKTNQVHKTYIALVQGIIESDHGFITQPIGIDPKNPRLRVLDENGQPAKTEWWKQVVIGNNTLVKIQLHTGRTHQIRVHFKSIGHPLIGDGFYGEQQSVSKRLMLHSQQIEMPKLFDNSGELQRFQTNTPETFTNP